MPKTAENQAAAPRIKTDETERLINWISKNQDDWRMLCHPAITDTQKRHHRRRWVEALRNFAKADFPHLMLVFMTKCYYMEGEARRAVEGAVIRRILSTWDENAINEFTDYLCRMDSWDARELPKLGEESEENKEYKKASLEKLINPESLI